MATFGKQRLNIVGVDSYLSYLIREDLETDSSTFTKDSPLIYTSGLLAEAATPVAAGTLIGFARRAGQNGTSKRGEYVVAYAGLLFHANFLAASAADNAIAAADKGLDFRMVKGATMLPDGTAAWYIEDNQTTPTGFMVSFETDQQLSNNSQVRVVAGDTNARPLFRVVSAAIQDA